MKQFDDRNLIPESALPRFNRAIASAFRLRNSVLAELLLIGVVYIVGIQLFWRQYGAFQTATWYGAPTPGGLKLSVTGIWYFYVSLPLFQFLLIRWYFRLFIWMRFLWQVSRIDLSLIPTPSGPRRRLGFLANSAFALMPLAVAHGALLSGWIAESYLSLRRCPA